MTAETTTDKPVRDSVKPTFISHGTLASRDLDRTRKFYEEFLNIECVRTSPISMMIRLGGDHIYAVVQSKQHFVMPMLNHNGLDLPTDEEVNEAWRTVTAHAEKWGLERITRPIAQHGTYSFMFWDFDGNSWEILSNPKGGYNWIFEKGDQEGKGHMDRGFRKDRPQ